MLFNSIEYFIFLPIVFLLYWQCKKYQTQNILLLAASYFFYGWWDYRFLLLITFSALCSYISGLALVRFSKSKVRRLVLILSVNINIFILCLFKYFDFFAENLAKVFRLIGYEIDILSLQLILPIGISFYTFQAISYTIDVYRNEIRPTYNTIAYFSYITFFPQLVAGPIERAKDLLPQLLKTRKLDYFSIIDGLRQILWGLFKKVCVADCCAAVVNQYWGDYSEMSILMYLQLSVLFAFQIYGDFSGYSDIAIGSAKLLGIKLSRNFCLPYFSRDIVEFWRRWHISLMAWLRDYIYYPLGGSRLSKLKSSRNIIVVFFISGIWHGANWTYIAWGLYNAALIILYSVIFKGVKHKNVIAENRSYPSIKEVGQIVMVFILSNIGWIFFRSDSLSQAVYIFQAIVIHPLYNETFVFSRNAFIYILIMISTEWIYRKKEYPLQINGTGLLRYRVCRWSIYYFFLFMICSMNGTSQAFIYFQF